ncbi:hypothetical protein [Noviherbaspirillum soli]|uniref:hypothetical protein n=1 Tax=Noviherbaspirillum soli TaxID=1064518 RepID=UPI001E4015AF|nr:hypothetical protein [Noviherbaspirillum soli]
MDYIKAIFLLRIYTGDEKHHRETIRSCQRDFIFDLPSRSLAAATACCHPAAIISHGLSATKADKRIFVRFFST